MLKEDAQSNINPMAGWSCPPYRPTALGNSYQLPACLPSVTSHCLNWGWFIFLFPSHTGRARFPETQLIDIRAQL